MLGSTRYSRDHDVPHVAVRPGDIVVDVRTDQGFFVCYAAYPGTRVDAFESNPESCDGLLSNVESNGLTDRVITKPYAIAEKDGRAALAVSRELGDGMTTINSKFARHTRLEVRKTIEVSTFTVTSVFGFF